MSISSNKQQKKGKDGMGKAGKRKEMVKDWCGTSCVWKSKCEQVVYGQVVYGQVVYGQVVYGQVVYVCMYVCMYACLYADMCVGQVVCE